MDHVGMLKQLEAFIPLQPKIVFPGTGRSAYQGSASDDRLPDIARQRVRGMMDKGMALDEIRKQFHMNEYKDWDRTQHLPITPRRLS